MAKYKDAITWISDNDAVADDARESYPVSILLVADLFKKSPYQVFKDVLAANEKRLAEVRKKWCID